MANITSTSSTCASSLDGTRIFYREWSAKDPIGVLLILHGMSEHSGRYAEFGSILAEKLGLRVIAPDHRAHGRTACPNDGDYKELGKFGTLKNLSSLNCLEVMATDALDIVKHVHMKTPEAPLFIFGHSMGSIIARWTMKIIPADLEANLHGVVLSGVPTVPAAYERVPLVIALKTCLFFHTGQDALHGFVMGQFDDAVRKLRKDKTLPKDCMISSVLSEVDEFHRDPLCGQTVDLLIWDSLRSTLIRLQKPGAFFSSTSPSKYPIMFLAGRDDPICAFAKTSVADAEKMRQIGFKVDEVFLDGCQHEFIKEKEEVKELGISKTVSWIKSKL